MENAEEYLNRREKQVDQREQYEANAFLDSEDIPSEIKEINRPRNWSAWEDNGKKEVTFGSRNNKGENTTTQLFVEYDSKVTDAMRKELDELEEENKLKGWNKKIDMGIYRRLTELRLVNGKNTFGLRDVIGERVDIYVCTEEKDPLPWHPASGYCVSLEDGKSLIVCRENPTSLKGIAIILHEAGHVLDFKNRLKRKDTRKNYVSEKEPLDPADAAEIIREERAAHAFVVKIFHRYFGDTKDIRNLLKVEYHGLKKYHTSVRRRIKGYTRDEYNQFTDPL